jgi:hypothetical protein
LKKGKAAKVRGKSCYEEEGAQTYTFLALEDNENLDINRPRKEINGIIASNIGML